MTMTKNLVNLTVQRACSQSDLPTEQQFFRWVNHAYGDRATATSVCIRLVEPQESQTLNRTFRQQDKPTNVLSFHYDVPDEIAALEPTLGDIVLCPVVLAREASEYGVALHDHYAHLVIHGMLHLLGHDHQTDDETQLMQSTEITYLAELNIGNPYEE